MIMECMHARLDVNEGDTVTVDNYGAEYQDVVKSVETNIKGGESGVHLVSGSWAYARNIVAVGASS